MSTVENLDILLNFILRKHNSLMHKDEKTGKYSKDVAASGLSWGFELESLAIGILGDAQEMEEKILLDLLMVQNELQPLLKKWEESPAEYSNGRSRTVREELAFLLNDVTTGAWHTAWEGSFGEHRKLSKWIVNDGETEYAVIRRVQDETSALKN